MLWPVGGEWYFVRWAVLFLGNNEAPGQRRKRRQQHQKNIGGVHE